MASPAISRAITATVRHTATGLTIGVAQALANGIGAGIAKEMPQMVTALGQALDTRALPRNEMKSINEGIARNAQMTMAAGYRSRLPRGAPNSGELSGTLGVALRSEAMTARTSDRVISFVNPEHLDRAARHWYRINYGARGPNLMGPGGQRPSTFTILANNTAIGVLRDPSPPAATSWLPARFFWVGDQLIATRRPGLPIGKGSRPAYFTDLGLEVVAREVGPAYDAFLRRFVQSAPNRARLARRHIVVPADIRAQTYGYEVRVR